jgi:hypothetical protein
MFRQVERRQSTEGFARGQLGSTVNFWEEEQGPAAFSLLLDGLRSYPDHRSELRHILEKSIDDLDEVDQNEVWALGQHYGMSTPLIDLSLSPYIALFFACADAANHPEESDANSLAIWGLAPLTFQAAIAEADELAVRFQHFMPRLGSNARIIAQQGRFTRTTPDCDLVAMADRLCETELSPKLQKITMPCREAEKTLMHLYRMNIYYGTLFPDLHGLCQFANHAAINPDYTGRAWSSVPWGFNIPGGHQFERNRRDENR